MELQKESNIIRYSGITIFSKLKKIGSLVFDQHNTPYIITQFDRTIDRLDRISYHEVDIHTIKLESKKEEHKTEHVIFEALKYDEKLIISSNILKLTKELVSGYFFQIENEAYIVPIDLKKNWEEVVWGNFICVDPSTVKIKKVIK